MRTLVFLTFYVFAACPILAQTSIGTWQALLNYSEALDVDELGDEVFVATKNALFVYNKTDNSLQTITRINGLSDVGIVKILAIPDKEVLLIGYQNGNMDLIRNRRITNIPDLRNSSIQGDKTIRHALAGPEFVYISTGLGILALDIDRREIRNTYRLVAAENIAVNQTAILDNVLYAATNQGLYAGNLDTDLTIFNNWEIDLGLPLPFGTIDHCATAGPNLFINQRGGSEPGLYVRTAEGTWEQNQGSNDILSLRSVPNGLTLSTFFLVQKRGPDGLNVEQNFLNYDGVPARPAAVHADVQGSLWVADLDLGLVRRKADGTFTFIVPDGPGTNRSFSLTQERGELWVASGTPVRPGVWGNSFETNGFYKYKDRTWTNYTRRNLPFLDEELFFDIPMVYRYPEARERVLVGSWFSGMIEMIEGSIVNHFTDVNSSLTGWVGGPRNDGKEWIAVTGFTPDGEGNVWMVDVRTEKPLSVYLADGTWKSFDLPGTVSATTPGFDMIMNRQGHLWMLFNREGVVVVDPKGLLETPRVNRIKKFTSSEGSGGLPTNDVFCIAEDLDGIIWVGTNDGIGVFFSPFDALSANPSDARPILVQQDGIFQPLFENQPISTIAVDGANRKWVGTFGSGVFLMSPDGTEQILNFTTANSPLLSDMINDIAIDPQSGEVYIATEQGLMVYTSDASAGQRTNNCTSVYPNPVREQYSGPISITGLMRGTEVRITDVRGNLVAAMVSNGGTAIWDGRNQNRERVATGVYFALSSSGDGASSCVSKILVVK